MGASLLGMGEHVSIHEVAVQRSLESPALGSLDGFPCRSVCPQVRLPVGATLGLLILPFQGSLHLGSIEPLASPYDIQGRPWLIRLLISPRKPATEFQCF